jgi:UDP-2,3-diacylglucosamine hydrolase
MAPKLGILAGGGPVPGHLFEACRATGRPVFIIAFEGQADPDVIGDAPHAWVRLGAVDEMLKLFRAEGVEEIVMAGPVRRPTLKELRPDRRAARFLARGLLNKGDNGLLGAIVRSLEEDEGFRVVGADTVLHEMRAPEGPFGKIAPDPENKADIGHGVRVLDATGHLDIGQAVVVQQGIVLGLEAAEGTQGLLARSGTLRREGRGGVLVKFPKAGQEIRADMPTIGPDTVADTVAAGLAGIAVGAGNTLVLDQPGVIAAADAAGIFIVGIRPRDYLDIDTPD